VAAVGPYDELCPEYALLARRRHGFCTDYAITVPQERRHPSPVEDLDAGGRCGILQKAVEPRPTGTVLGSTGWKLDVHEGVVLSQPYDTCGRRDRPDRLA
jgi:hypothetical protein